MTDPQAAELVVPPGYEFQSLDESGNFRTVSGGKPVKISCECSSVGECVPVYIVYNSESKVLECGGSCLICIKKVGGAVVVSAGFVESRAAITVAADVSQLPPVFEAMFHDDGTMALVEGFVADAWGEAAPVEFEAGGQRAQAPPGTALVGVNLRGHGLLVLVPEGYARTMGTGTDSGSCSCTEGDCTFQTKTLPGGGSMYYCTGGCKGACTLLVTGTVRPVERGVPVQRR